MILYDTTRSIPPFWSATGFQFSPSFRLVTNLHILSCFWLFMTSSLNRHTFRIGRLDYMGRIIHTLAVWYVHIFQVRSHAQSAASATPNPHPHPHPPNLIHMHIIGIGHILSLTSDAKVAKFKVKWLFLLLCCCFGSLLLGVLFASFDLLWGSRFNTLWME